MSNPNTYYIDAFLVKKNTVFMIFHVIQPKNTFRQRNPRRVLLLLKKDSKTQ